MKTKKKIIEDLVKREGGYVNDSSDSGGATRYGVTQKVARKYGYYGSMKQFPLNRAMNIYEKRYWDKLKLDEVYKYSPLIAEELFDTGVNMGTRRAGEFLQRSLNLLTSSKLIVDGSVGKKTLKALKVYHNKRGEHGKEVLHKMLNALQGSFYVTLAERRVKDKKFIFGWFKHRVT